MATEIAQLQQNHQHERITWKTRDKEIHAVDQKPHTNLHRFYKRNFENADAIYICSPLWVLRSQRRRKEKHKIVNAACRILLHSKAALDKMNNGDGSDKKNNKHKIVRIDELWAKERNFRCCHAHTHESSSQHEESDTSVCNAVPVSEWAIGISVAISSALWQHLLRCDTLLPLFRAFSFIDTYVRFQIPELSYL